MDKHEFREQVYKNWKSPGQHEQNPCEGCCLRDTNLHSSARPQFGGFNFNADIMLVNETPAFLRPDTEYANSGRQRIYRDTPKGAFENDNKATLENAPESIDESISTPDNPSPQFDSDPYGRSFLEKSDWGTLDDLRRNLFSEMGGALNIPMSETYYTNAIKCPKVGPDRKDTTGNKVIDYANCNSDGTDNCRSYLEMEILEHICPDVIIAGGDSAIDSVASVLGIEKEVSGNIIDLIDNNSGRCSEPKLQYAAYGSDTKLIPCYQFSTGLQNSHWICKRWAPNREFEEGEKYEFFFNKMADRIAYETSEAIQRT